MPDKDAISYHKRTEDYPRCRRKSWEFPDCPSCESCLFVKGRSVSNLPSKISQYQCLSCDTIFNFNYETVEKQLVT